ncbi:MAG: type I DNA topoisomerase [Planctomycetes bacterium]|nr:type I DNA topoisomerase [Planctomycetota bacterium]
MAKKLVIVESPTKARIIKKILGSEYAVESSGGHIRDLPEKRDHLNEDQKKLPYASLGINIEDDFAPLYCSSPSKKKNLLKLKKLVDKDTIFYIATDEDREGEAIAWHLNELLNPDKDHKAYRMVFHEITKQAILAAFENPREIDIDRVNAQQARRILDRLVGYKLSPLLWKKIRFGLSAGRVQSVAVRMVVDREKDIKAFVADEYWSIKAQIEEQGKNFEATLNRFRDEKIIPSSKAEVDGILEAVQGSFRVSAVDRKQVRKNPYAPFITSTLQQDSSRKLGYSVNKTMQLAQRLYEGVDLKGSEGATGLITYMRTDSVTLSQEAIRDSRAVIEKLYGKEYLPESPRVYKNRSRLAQEAHEAIRPTDCSRTPQSLAGKIDEDMLKLYDLIWKRTLGSQTNSATFDAMTIDFTCGEYAFRSTGQVMTFAGFTKIYTEGTDSGNGEEDSPVVNLPSLEVGAELKPLGLTPQQHFTKPPPRFTEASLVKKMEEEGIGRPSTYAPTISTIISRGYVRMEKKQLFATDTADVVNGLLVQHFDNIVDLKFTASMEDDLDRIAKGEMEYLPFLRNFYTPFEKLLEEKDQQIKKQDVVNEPTDEVCEECGKPMVIKLGRLGKFLSCSDYPVCKNAKTLGEDTEERRALKEKFKDEKCHECGAPMALKGSKFGDFLACSAYPKCKTTRPIIKSTGVTCPMW